MGEGENVFPHGRRETFFGPRKYAKNTHFLQIFIGAESPLPPPPGHGERISNGVFDFSLSFSLFSWKTAGLRHLGPCLVHLHQIQVQWNATAAGVSQNWFRGASLAWQPRQSKTRIPFLDPSCYFSEEAAKPAKRGARKGRGRKGVHALMPQCPIVEEPSTRVASWRLLHSFFSPAGQFSLGAFRNRPMGLLIAIVSFQIFGLVSKLG